MKRANKINNSYMDILYTLAKAQKNTALSEVVSASLRTYFEIRWGVRKVYFIGEGRGGVGQMKYNTANQSTCRLILVRSFFYVRQEQRW